MQRRTFLGLVGALAAGGLAAQRALIAHAAPTRLEWWEPAAGGKLPPDFVALEWRYLAGRITRGAEDFGFVVSLADYNPLPPFINVSRAELLVMREDLTGAQPHATRTYDGTLAYDAATATYSFSISGNPAVSASWRLDTATQRYSLSVASPELTLSELLITPQGELIPEGGTGIVSSGSFSYNGVPVVALSDYYADWATLSSGGSELGLGRLDMQTLRPNFSGSGSAGFSHHWFALAVTLEDDTPAWVSGWQILAGSSIAWGVTVATGRGASWQVASIGSDSGFSGRQPLAISILDYQAIPGAPTPQITGKRWRMRAGQVADSDTLDVEIAVPPGQFIEGARISVATDIRMQEAVGTSVRGLVGGKAIKAATLAIVESTLSVNGAPPAPRQRVALPLVRS